METKKDNTEVIFNIMGFSTYYAGPEKAETPEQAMTKYTRGILGYHGNVTVDGCALDFEAEIIVMSQNELEALTEELSEKDAIGKLFEFNIRKGGLNIKLEGEAKEQLVKLSYQTISRAWGINIAYEIPKELASFLEQYCLK